jgi:hypothetical protein
MSNSDNTQKRDFNAVFESVKQQGLQKLSDEHFKKYRIDPLKELLPPQIAIKVNNGILGTLGNISLFTGKAKAKKSFVIGMMVSTALDSTMHGILKNELPSDKKTVLYFDTEQGEYHVQKAVKRICKQVGKQNPENLHAYFLRSHTPAERVEFIEHLIYNTENIGVVCIDGIKDLITSINDEEQATNIVSKLMKWSAECNVHIITVLHQNKGDNNARGHIGTELQNKAETIITVTAIEGDKTISTVEVDKSREQDFEPFSIAIDSEGMPFIMDYCTPTTKPKDTGEKMPDWRKLDEGVMYEIVEKCFSSSPSLGAGELQSSMQNQYFNRTKKNIGTNYVKAFINHLKDLGFIYQKQPKQPYFLAKQNFEDNTDEVQQILDQPTDEELF